MDATKTLGLRLLFSIVAVFLIATAATAAEPGQDRHCQAVGGSLMTNFISDTTTLGTATGDLRGAVSATLLGSVPAGDSVIFSVQHHWVTDAGDTIFMDPAQATTKPLPAGLFALTSYPIKITGGTGRFAGATGQLDAIGELDATTGRTVFRYYGDVCFPRSSK